MVMTNLRKQLSHRKLLLFFVLMSGALGLIFLVQSTTVTRWRLRRMLQEAQLDDAVALGRTTIKAHPGCAECCFLLARATRRSGLFAESEENLKSAEQLGWDSQLVHRERVLAAVQTGRVRPMEGELKAIFARELTPEETEEVYEALANGHASAFDAPEFFKCIDYWLDWRPGDIKPRQMRAEFILRLGDHARAAEEFREVLKTHPEQMAARFGLAECLLVLNRPSEAEELFRICHDTRPTPRSALGLAKSLVRIDRADEALLLLQKFENTEDRVVLAEMLEELGRWYLDRERLTEASSYLQKCVEIAPENYSAWHALSMAQSMQGDSNEARTSLEMSQSLQRDARRMFEIMSDLTKSPESIDLRLEAAEIMFRQKKNDEAVAWLSSILDSSPHNLPANRRLAEHYRSIGQNELASQCDDRATQAHGAETLSVPDE
jgi:tetratricopeptide (TPR) repeat protein